ncbi:MAG: hypothetical protein GX051_09520 [Clostridiales bacterium]|nr:hypothetical protein [Clostridiales bacterium]
MNISFDTSAYPQIKPLSFGNIESSIEMNSLYYTENGKPKVFVAGEFHFERYPRELWEEEILKMKAGGIDVISTYIIWLFHEPKKGCYRFDGDFDDGYFLALCKKHGMRVIMRIGPYCHGELRHGGLPDFVFRLPYNRSDNPKYLSLAEKYWEKLYENTKDYFDGETVVGIQLENEYVKGFDHLLTLRRLAEKVGFKVPVFTVTGWGFTFDNNDLQGTYGGYPARPWAQHRHSMPVQGNFTIRKNYHTCDGIGTDVIDYSSAEKPVKNVIQPNFTCECGCGNQVTEHRREIISAKDAYGVPFATVANGCNWLGYYMYHGGSNPRGGLYQESRRTLSPNNLPVIDYDFQAPLGRFGLQRKSYHMLRNLNNCLQYFGDGLAKMHPFYSSKFDITDETDAITPRICVRADENGSGFLFASTYERDKKMPPLEDVKITVKTSCGERNLPVLNMKPDEFLMYPFNIRLGNTAFDYITAMPIAHYEKNGITTFFFKITGGHAAEYSVNNRAGTFSVSNSPEIIYNEFDKKTRIVVMSEALSEDFYLFGNKVVFTNAVIYENEGLIIEYKRGDYCTIDGKSISLETPGVNTGVRLKNRKPFHGRYSSFLFSPGKRQYYTLTAENLAFGESVVDYILDFKFEGSALQMYYNGSLVNDFFNIDGSHTMSLKYFKDELLNGRLDIVTAPFAKRHPIYTEAGFKFNNAALKAVRLTAIYSKKLI